MEVSYEKNNQFNDNDMVTSTYQFLPVITLDNMGHVIQGKSYQQGYINIDEPDYFNKIALLDRIKTLTSDEKAYDLPF